MTTREAAARYMAEHIKQYNSRPYNVFNPHDKPLEELPVIYGFNNGGSGDWRTGQIIAEDGTALGSHICSNEAYMYSDLGVVGDSRQDDFKKHYPDGYRMDFVHASEVKAHKGLTLAYKRNQEKAALATTERKD